MTDDEVSIAYTKALQAEGAVITEAVITDPEGNEHERFPLVWVPGDPKDGGRTWTSHPAKPIDLPAGWGCDFIMPVKGTLNIYGHGPS